MKKVSLLLCFAFASLTVSAQESGVSAEAGRKATFVRNGFWDNWFVGAGAGGSVYFGPADNNADFLDRVTVNPSLFVGKWFNPYLGVRFAGQAGTIHTFDGSKGERMYSQDHANARVDFMVNATNYLLRYKENRFYNFIPTVGIGAEHRFDDGFKKRGFNGPTFHGGLLNTFRLSNRLSAFVEVSGYMVEKRFDRGPQGGTRWNGIATGTAGLILKVGKVGFSEATLMDDGLVKDLNDRLNKLQRDNDELRKRPVSCPPAVTPVPCPPVPPVESSDYVPNVVFFRLNNANIDANQQISIFNTAEYLKANPSAKVKVVGYADKKTGTAAYNDKLSERRSKNVAKVLVEKYGISSDRVQVEWKGSSEQPYKENAWNRVAIFFAQ